MIDKGTERQILNKYVGIPYIKAGTYPDLTASG